MESIPGTPETLWALQALRALRALRALQALQALRRVLRALPALWAFRELHYFHEAPKTQIKIKFQNPVANRGPLINCDHNETLTLTRTLNPNPLNDCMCVISFGWRILFRNPLANRDR